MTFTKRLIMGHSCRMRSVFLGILICRIGGNLRRDVISDALRDSVRIGEQCAELLVEGFQNIAQAI